MKKLLFIFFCFISTPVLSQPRIETFQLNHRLAVDVLPDIQAFLPQDATARAFNDFIIIKAEPADLKQIKQLIRQIDLPLQRLRITVVKTYDVLHDKDSQTISAHVDVRDRDLTGSVAIQRWSTQDTKNNEQYYQAQGLANRPIYIDMGEDIPKEEHYLVLRQEGNLAIQSQTDYLKITSGFKAVARVLPNNQVIVDIHPRFGELTHTGRVETSQIITTLSGPASTWIELGQIDNEKSINKYGTTAYKSHNKRQQHIYLKVDQLH